MEIEEFYEKYINFQKYNIKKDILPLFFEKCLQNIRYDYNYEIDSELINNLNGIIKKNTFKKGKTSLFLDREINMYEFVDSNNISNTGLLITIPILNKKNNEFYISFKPSFEISKRPCYRHTILIVRIIIDGITRILEKIFEKLFEKYETNKNITSKSDYNYEFNEKYDIYNLSTNEILYKEEIINKFLSIAKKYKIDYNLLFKDNKIYIKTKDISIFNESVFEKIPQDKEGYILSLNLVKSEINYINQFILDILELEKYL